MKSTLLFVILLLTQLVIGQSAQDEELLALQKTYRTYQFIGKTPKEVLVNFTAKYSPEMKTTARFIQEVITTKNTLLTPTFLNRPSDTVLKNLYIIRALDNNANNDFTRNTQKIIDSLRNANSTSYELLSNYYDLLFISVGNKNQPFNMASFDLKIDSYQLKDDTEKAVLFLQCMRMCGTQIWGYMNIVKPANTKKALSEIKKYPKVNGKKYYEYKNLFFPDFNMQILVDKPEQSYKTFYLEKYYEVLLSHLLCLVKETKSTTERTKLMELSILPEQSLYQYTTLKEVLIDLFPAK